MIIYYIAAIYPSKYRKYIKNNGVVPAYKFNKLFAEGFQNVPNVQVKCIVPQVITAQLNKQGIRPEYEEENNIQYIFFNDCDNGYVEFIKHALKSLSDERKENKLILVCDVLSFSSSMLCYLAKFLYKIETVGIVTDIPQYMVGTVRGIKTKVIDKCNNFFMRRFDKYVFLTEAMNEFLNKKNKPYCVMEGICDENESQRVNELENKYSKKVCMYAGSLHKEYGIALLIDAFLKANPEESELHIYGNGNYVDKVKEFADSHDNIVYAGVVTGDVVVERECKATLLVNPRTTEGAYTKYSFPSKTLEYLASGTPVLMTKLPGMPEEYCDYVFLFEEESVDGYVDKLKEILAKSKEELHRDGLKGKQFVLEKKNNIYQAMKVFKQLNL